MKPNDTVTAWKKQQAIDRLHMCKTMLNLHGFLTDAESKRVYKRMLRWVEKHWDDK